MFFTSKNEKKSKTTTGKYPEMKITMILKKFF